MPYVNQRSSIVTDSNSNIYNFAWTKEGLVLIYFNKKTEKTQNHKIVENCSLEFDVTIDNKDNIYLVCQKKDGSILLITVKGESWNESIIVEAQDLKVYNLSIIENKSNISIFYCVTSEENSNALRIYHHLFNQNRGITVEVDDIRKREILNPYKVLIKNGDIAIVYYDLIDNGEQVFIKSFNSEKGKWNNKIQLTTSNGYKLYLDALLDKNEQLYLIYSEYQDDNLVIKFEKHELFEDSAKKLSDRILSNPGNGSYPTLIINGDELWGIWIEYESLLSSFSTDGGDSWSNPYLWRISKESDFLRYKFISKDQNINNHYKLNYSFGQKYPNIAFIGFGPLDDATEVPLKSKKKEEQYEYEENKLVEEIRISKNYNRSINEDKVDKVDKETSYDKILEMEKRITRLEEYLEEIKGIDNKNINENHLNKIEEIEGRLISIENYLNRRRRGGIFGSNK